MALPTNIDTTYADGADASIALHQQHHDTLHAAVNGLGLARVTSTVTVTNSLTETTFFTYTVLANAPVVGDVYRLTAWGRYFNNSGSTVNSTFRLKFGSTTLHTTSPGYGSNAAQRVWIVRWNLLMTAVGASGGQQGLAELLGTATGQDGSAWTAFGTSESQLGYGSASEATNANKNLVLTLQHGSLGSQVSGDIRGALLERLAAA